jgi:CRISPR/Cas system endoribonuclease Cas6 (RAMP superfamily)
VLRRIEAANPLTGERRIVMGEGQTMIQMPQAGVTNEMVEAQARRLADELDRHTGRLTITFHTPTRIVEKKELCKTPRFRPLFQRLFERVVQLSEDFAGAPPQAAWDELQTWAEAVELVEDRTEWWDVHGHSRRLGRPQPIGGLVGHAVYRAEDWRPLLPWLLWGVCVHVGKNAVKGSGMITIAAQTQS